MYGKYDQNRINKEIDILKKIKHAYLEDNSLNPEFLTEAYLKFKCNIEKLKTVFPYKRIHINEIAMAPYDEIWTWDSDEELERTKTEILKFGLYLPIIVLEKGFIHTSKNAGIDKYHVLDGNHRVGAMLSLYRERKVSGYIYTFIFPSYCTDVRKKMNELYYGDKYNHHKEIELYVFSHAIKKLKIKRFFDAKFEKIIDTVKVKNKLEIYNCAMHIGHEITPYLYIYYSNNNIPPKDMINKMIKIEVT